jgi:hypothetical protein
MSDRLDEIRALLADVKRGAVFPSCERADTDMRWLVAEVERTQADLAAARTVLDGAYRLPRGTSPDNSIHLCVNGAAWLVWQARRRGDHIR